MTFLRHIEFEFEFEYAKVKLILTRQESSMIHLASPQSHCRWILKFCAGRTDGTDNMCENSDHYRPGLWSASWINKKSLSKRTVDQSSMVISNLE